MKTIKEYVMRKHFNENGYLIYLETENDLVRCEDCVHFKQSKVLGNTCALTDNHVTEKDYCSKAERKENGN